MKRHAQLVALPLLAVAFANPASAHKLKVFATLEGNTISGYGFFIGGGRPQGSAVIIRDAAAREVYRSSTDAEGRYAWTAPAAGNYTVVINTREGHMAEATVAAERFAGSAPVAPAATPASAAAEPSAGHGSAGADGEIERRLETVVARQVRPLLERIEQLDARLRLADVISGVCLIVGLGGIGLWASGRKRGIKS
jgi:nickel transport protein